MIYLIGGTHDSRQLCEWLNAMEADYFMSVATALGESTYQDVAKRLVTGRLDELAMGQLLSAERVSWVIDASHPHASAVSQTAMKVCEKHHIKYTRWLRGQAAEQVPAENAYGSFEEAFQYLADKPGRVLITGSKELEKALAYLDKTRVVARIVPNSESIQICERLGLDAGQVIGLKGPFSDELNQLIFKEWQIKHIVFKESGAGSGFEAKLQAARACQVSPLVVTMPKLDYPDSAASLADLTKRYQQIFQTEVSDETI